MPPAEQIRRQVPDAEIGKLSNSNVSDGFLDSGSGGNTIIFWGEKKNQKNV